MGSTGSLYLFILIFVYGLLIGSFLNVCIYRIPLGKTIVRGRSYCPNCHSLIPWYLNIPVFSYLFLKGRCKNCHTQISIIYPAVELLNAVLYLLIYGIYGFTLQALVLAVLFSVLIIIALIDLKYQIIPDSLVTIIFISGVLYTILMTISGAQLWYIGLIGLFSASLPLYLLGLVYEGGIGGGDIKLMAAAGLLAGWKLILLSLFLGAIYASFLALFMVIFRKATFKTALPFGPFLAAGIVTAILFGQSMLNAYMDFYQYIL